MNTFKGKVVLVTGGGTGIGRATALAFGQEGATVIVAGRRTETGLETVRLIEETGGKAGFVQADVTKEAAVKALVERISATYGSLDIAFNNAGVEGQGGPLTGLSEEGWDEIFDGNVKSTWLSMKYEIPAMLKQGRGVIINNSSIVGHIGSPGIAAYSAAKHAVVGLTKSAALEYAKSGVRINVVSPGAVETPMADRMFGSSENLNKTFGALHPIGRAAKPEEIASAVVWLAAETSSFVTGLALTVDGGYTAQ
jgi:NAD(P)-dependent dehydrogenase (short-subunit alcohol dehydrogenase family)